MEPTASLELAVREAAGERLDKFVSQLMPHISRSRIQRAIETGEITVHGSLERASYRLRRGDVVMTEEGSRVFTGGRKGPPYREADFVEPARFPELSRDMRARLTELEMASR